MSTVAEIKAAIESLTRIERAELERWLHGKDEVSARESELNPEEDSPELEAELLKAVDGPHDRLRESELKDAVATSVQRRRARQLS